VEDPDDDLLRYQVFDTGLEVPITIHQLFAAPTPGTYTYWLNELNFNTDSYYAMRQVRFTLLYIPSTYGLMNLDDQTTRRLSDAEERAAELARHQAAMKEELAEQRRIIEQLQHRLDASRPASRSD
jgi:hypothetical protein